MFKYSLIVVSIILSIFIYKIIEGSDFNKVCDNNTKKEFNIGDSVAYKRLAFHDPEIGKVTSMSCFNGSYLYSFVSNDNKVAEKDIGGINLVLINNDKK